MKPKFTTAELYQLYQDGLSINGVAKKTGLSFALVQNRFAKAGLKTRNHSEAQKLAYIKQRRKPAGAVTISGPDHWCWKSPISLQKALNDFCYYFRTRSLVLEGRKSKKALSK